MIDFTVMRDKLGGYIGTVCNKCNRYWEREVWGFPVTYRCLCHRADFGQESTPTDYARRAAWERENARMLRAMGTKNAIIIAEAHERSALAYEQALKC